MAELRSATSLLLENSRSMRWLIWDQQCRCCLRIPDRMRCRCCFWIPDRCEGWYEISASMPFSPTPPSGMIFPIFSHLLSAHTLTLITALCLSQQSLSPRHTYCIHLIIPAVADACFSIRRALAAMTFRPDPWRHLWKQISNQPESLGRNETEREGQGVILTRYASHLSWGKERRV